MSLAGLTEHPDIRLIGTGIDPVRHLTPEAIAALRASRRVYHLTAFHDHLAPFCDDLVNWSDLYLSARTTDVYSEMARVLLAEAETSPGVAFAVYGHPFVFVSTCVMVISEAPSRGLVVDVVSGISSIDVLLSHLYLDAGLAGLQVLEPWSIVDTGVPPNPSVSCFIMQVASLSGDALNASPTCRPESLRPLQDVLLKAYRPDHPAIFITAPYLPNSVETRVTSTVAGMTEIGEHDVHVGMTLYLPPASSN